LLNAKKFQHKFENMKDYDVFIALKNQSGFGWNEELQVPECRHNTWIRYVEHNEHAKKFKDKGLPNLDKLVDILGEKSYWGVSSFTRKAEGQKYIGRWAGWGLRGLGGSVSASELQPEFAGQYRFCFGGRQ